jgi:hypothetical protein
LPTVWLLKVRLEGETEATGATPVPLKFTVCGLLLALSLRVTVPLKDPVFGGEKVTLMVQVAAAAKLELQVLV